ncbi:SCO4402 family protein [Streptomyces sp. NPDC055506]
MTARHDITLPDMRAEIVVSVRALADPAYQRRVWIDREYPSPDYYDDLTLTVNILYDDTTVLADPQAALGRTLASEAEVEAMSRLADELTRALDEVGRDQPDERFLASPAWPSVVDAASAALTVLTTG